MWCRTCGNTWITDLVEDERKHWYCQYCDRRTFPIPREAMAVYRFAGLAAARELLRQLVRDNGIITCHTEERTPLVRRPRVELSETE